MRSRLIESASGHVMVGLLSRLLFVAPARRLLVHLTDLWLKSLLSRGLRSIPRDRIGVERAHLARAILHTVDRLVSRRALSPRVTRVALGLWAREALSPAAEQAAARRFRAEHGCAPPWFVVLSPGHACNLRCAGCYANSGPDAVRLHWGMLDHIIAEARRLWGIPLVVFSGGEPLAYRSEGRDILDVAASHPDCMYLMFTNGTLIDEATALRVAQLGGMTPAISVEGLRDRTDGRRGNGTFDRVLKAMMHLRRVGVPFGVSVTVTRENCEEVLSDEFLDFFFTEQGAFYGFLFHYMPIGRGSTLEWMPTPQQRIEFWRRSWDVVASKRIFLFDFWNSGPLVQGCVSAGREGGYLYVDWGGRIMPCVFAPYAVASVQDLYAQGKTLNDVWEAPFFRAIRQWQQEYGYGHTELTKESNWLRPCPIRDHHRLFRQWVEQYKPEPQDEAARQALLDDDYYRGLVAYGDTIGACSQPIWESEYVSGERS